MTREEFIKEASQVLTEFVNKNKGNWFKTHGCCGIEYLTFVDTDVSERFFKLYKRGMYIDLETGNFDKSVKITDIRFVVSEHTPYFEDTVEDIDFLSLQEYSEEEMRLKPEKTLADVIPTYFLTNPRPITWGEAQADFKTEVVQRQFTSF